MKKRSIVSAGIISCLTFFALQLQGAPLYSIIAEKNAPKLDKLAVKELQEYIKKSTNITVPVNNRKAKHLIFVGKHAQIEKAFGKKRLQALQEDESLVKSDGKNLYLTGGGRFGTVYAVYCYLENQLGIRFYDVTGAELVPKRKSLVLHKFSYRQKPALKYRLITTSEYHKHPNAMKFLFRNRLNMIWGNYRSNKDLDVRLKINTPMCHTIFYYITPTKKHNPYNWKWDEPKDYFKTNPEYFAMNQQGKRVTNLQLCFSNPALRKEFTRRFKERVRRTKHNLYLLGANDWPGKYCFCKGCQALEKKYSCIAGPLLDYMIELCKDLEKTHPGVVIRHAAYRKEQSERPPSPAIRFPKNFSVGIAAIDDDVTKDLTHKNNADTLRNIRAWAQMASHVDVNLYPCFGGTPSADFERIANSMKAAHKAGIHGSHHEHDVNVFLGFGFTDLMTYFLAKLYQDPALDWKKVVNEFVSFYYGKAGELMKSYLYELQSIRSNTKTFILWDGNISLQYPDFYLVRFQMLFDRMEELTKNSPVHRGRVRATRAELDLITLQRYQRLKKFRLPYTAEMLRDRCLAIVKEAQKRRFPTDKSGMAYWSRGFLRAVGTAYMMNSVEPKPLPESFRKIPPHKIRQTVPVTTAYAKSVPYKEGAFGYAMRDPKNNREMPFTFGFYDQQNKKHITRNKLTRKDIVIDKFHLYKMGTVTISQKCRLYLMSSWRAHVQLEKFHRLGFPDKKYDLYVSLKFEGPFYGKSKSKADNVWMDRVVLVEKD